MKQSDKHEIHFKHKFLTKCRKKKKKLNDTESDLEIEMN